MRALALKEMAVLWLLPPLLGAAGTLGFAPYGYYGLTLLAYAGLIALWWSSGVGRSALMGFLFGLGYFASGLYWVFISTHYYGGAPAAVGVFLVVALSLLMSLYFALAGALSGVMRNLPRSLWSLLLVPGIILMTELLRARLGTGFPWLSPGYALTDAPVHDLIPVVGVYGVGSLLIAVAGALVLLVRGYLRERLLVLGLFVATPFAVWAMPAALSWTQAADSAIPVAVLQGNIPQGEKWQRERRSEILERYRKLTSEARGARLIVWPEVTLPALEQHVQPFIDDVDRRARARRQTVLLGVLATPDGELYNAVLAKGMDSGRYYKRHLVPYGEYFPVPDFLLPLLKGVNLRYSDFTHGPEAQTLIRVDGMAIGLSICFEDAFGYEIRKALPEAGLLVNMTNDAWFEDSTAPHQHLQIARMRAMEAGRPMLRAANTGISAIISADGRLLQASPQFEVDSLSMNVRPRSGATPYVRFGDAPLWLFALIAVGGGMGWALLRRRL
jgi:apolipoprotein N-acyltransferase